jgi:adenylylsulfate kinase
MLLYTMSKILVCGLSGSGKTTLANALADKLNYARLNADELRAEANDWDFSAVGRMRQAQRIAEKLKLFDDVVVDTIAPLKLHRAVINADKVIWMNTCTESKYKDTDDLFETPASATLVITNFTYDVDNIVKVLTS